MSHVDFPGNYDYYLQNGQKLLRKRKLKEGLAQLEAAYQIKQDPVVNWLIATTAFELADYQKSLSYISELPHFYLGEENRAELYLQNLLMSKQYLSARKTLWEIQKLGEIDKKKVQSFYALIDAQEDFYQQTQVSMIREVRQELDNLPELPAVYQLQTVKKIINLPQAELLEVSHQLMVNPRVSLLVRNFLFEELVQLGIRDSLSILTIDGNIHKLSPKQIGISASNSLKNDIFKRLEETLGNQDPVLFANLIEEVKVELALLYPLHEFYQNSQSWVNSYLSEFQKVELPLDKKIEEIRKKIRKELNGFYVK